MITDKQQHEMLKENTKTIETWLSEYEEKIENPNNILHGLKECYGYFQCARLNNIIFAGKDEEFRERFDKLFDTLEDR